MTTFGAYLASYRQNDRTHLLCVGLCRRRRPRTEFRETPWHGRAAECIRCETFPGPAGRSQRQIEEDAKARWVQEQTEERLRMYRRYVHRLRWARFARPTVTSAEVVSEALAHHRAVEDACRLRWAMAWPFMVRAMECSTTKYTTVTGRVIREVKVP
ncbi:hypothetical protein ACIGW0_31440 [Streptomyces bikiniensis]|uniref:Uncharacterized protein n=1 Tax=Streptomyces bikiniensis TaxID=1896 RepID=A0ABW8D5D4_STRBI